MQQPSRKVFVGRTTWLMALGQQFAPALADRQAAKMITAQQGDPQLPRLGNLDHPEEGPAAIDGRDTERVIRPWIGFVSSRQIAALKVAAVGVLAGLAVTAGFAIRSSKR